MSSRLARSLLSKQGRRVRFTTLAALAHLAPSVTLATAVAPIYHRSPASMAQTAATVDDLSGGRFRHGTRLIRFRPDKAPGQCRLDEIAAPGAAGLEA